MDVKMKSSYNFLTKAS